MTAHTGMVSVEGELVPLKTRIKPNDANGAVEKWLVQVRRNMHCNASLACTYTRTSILRSVHVPLGGHRLRRAW
jgi:hypothetical protein